MRNDVLARYTKFVRGLRTSPSREVSAMFGVVAGDVSTSTGQNLDLIRWETGLDPLSSSLVELKAALATGVPAVPVMDTWRLDQTWNSVEFFREPKSVIYRLPQFFLDVYPIYSKNRQ